MDEADAEIVRALMKAGWTEAEALEWVEAMAEPEPDNAR